MINLTKFDEHDYDCFGGVETNDYFQDAFITWELQYHDYETAKNSDCCLVLDAYGLAFYYSDYDSEKIYGYTWECSTSEAIEWLKKYDNNTTLELSDFLGTDWKPQTDKSRIQQISRCL